MLQGDFRKEVSDYPKGCFDVVVLSQTLQQIRDPKELLTELLRIGKRVIVSVITSYSIHYTKLYDPDSIDATDYGTDAKVIKTFQRKGGVDKNGYLTYVVQFKATDSMYVRLRGTNLPANVPFVITSYSIHYTKLYEPSFA